MKKFIEKISATLPYREDQIEITLKGKNLILTGSNGSGKTSLVESIQKKLIGIMRSNIPDQLKQWETSREHWINVRNSAIKDSWKYKEAKEEIEHLDNSIEEAAKGPNIAISDLFEFSRMLDNGLGIIELFSAVRQSQIQDARSASATNYDKEELNDPWLGDDIGNQLEQHLVNLYTRRSFSITEHRDRELEQDITKWLFDFDNNLKFLMEDSSAHLKFDANNFKFYIMQDRKEPYTFQDLSSGYSSIFSVLSTLLMRAEYLKVSPSKLCGVAIIDEIDAHLHVTLQRKILPFLTESFPGIQYIVTTHSPFVLTSVNNAEIYDISKREQVGDLSSYSYESVLEGLFGVSSASDILQNKIRDIANKIDDKNTNLEELIALINKLESNQEMLDEESKFYLNSAKFKINKIRKGVDK